MAEIDGNERASPGMIRLAVLNSASIQLLPTTIAAVRLSAGSNSPFDILPAVWLTSACALLIGMTATFLLEKLSGGKT
jgi:spore maturation protein A